MSAYHEIDGLPCTASPEIMTTLLRDELGFDGVVVSDWFGSHSTVESVNAGLNLEMPGPPRDRGANLIDAVRDGLLWHADQSDLNRAVLGSEKRNIGTAGAWGLDRRDPETNIAPAVSMVLAHFAATNTKKPTHRAVFA